MTVSKDGLTASIAVEGGKRLLTVRSVDQRQLNPFTGTATGMAADQYVLEGELSAANAAALRQAFTHLRPVPLGKGTSAGVGDRLGLATAGHVRAFQKYGVGVTPVFAQQSIREMDRLDRTPQQVMDDATFGCVQEGWTGAVGSDTDHIHSIEGIDRGLAAGFTTFTLDPGDYVRDTRAGVTREQIDALPWPALEDDEQALVARYADVPLDLNGHVMRPARNEVLEAAVKYGEAVAFTIAMYRHLQTNASYPVEVEFAVDETDFVTSHFEHHYLAKELTRLGMTWESFAPRYADGFEKGVEYIGEVADLVANIEGHVAVAELHGDYKISIHSGSDKFSIYQAVVEATGGRIHLKTSGTSYLTALDVAAVHAPQLFREIYQISSDAYGKASNTYQVSADLSRAPEVSSVSDLDLPDLVEAFDTRQILHVGYGNALMTTNTAGDRWIDTQLRQTLLANYELYTQRLTEHLGRHLVAFSQGAVR